MGKRELEEKLGSFETNFFCLYKEVDRLRQKLEGANGEMLMRTLAAKGDPTNDQSQGPLDDALTDLVCQLTESLINSYPSLGEGNDGFLSAIDAMEINLGDIANELEKFSGWNTNSNWDRNTNLTDDP